MQTPTLQRRHGPACTGGHSGFSFELEELRKGWKRCRCRIWAHGTLNGIFHRLATRQREWQAAREILDIYLAAGRWTLPDPPSPPAGPPAGPPARRTKERTDSPPSESAGTPIADAVNSCLEEGEKLWARATLIRYRLVLAEFEQFARELGLRYVEEFTPAHIYQLRSGWRVSRSSARTKLSCVKIFFERFRQDGVIQSNPARIYTPRTRLSFPSAQKNPFTDEELERMLERCQGYMPLRQTGDGAGVEITRYRNFHRFTGEDLADFIQLSCYTGLRISDVVTFHIDRLTPAGEVKLCATKNGEWVSVWIPEWLQARIRTRAARVGPLIFGRHATSDVNVMTCVWRRKLNQLWASCGPWKEKPTPHRFRHTFVRILLEHQVPVSVIARLTGDTEQMIRKHYSAWMPGQQQATSRILRQAFEHTPRLDAGLA